MRIEIIRDTLYLDGERVTRSYLIHSNADYFCIPSELTIFSGEVNQLTMKTIRMGDLLLSNGLKIRIGVHYEGKDIIVAITKKSFDELWEAYYGRV